MGRRSSNELVVIMWRDIPAQINGRSGDERVQVMLPHRFQKAIDRAAMVAGKKTAQDYVGEWRRANHPVVGELTDCVSTTAASIEAEFTNERLHVLVANGGWDPASPEAPATPADIPVDPNPDEPDTTDTDTTDTDTTDTDTTDTDTTISDTTISDTGNSAGEDPTS